jgi:energy-coupling factor transporter ATP-binding protein EcfA2
MDLDHGLALLAPQFPEYFFSRLTVAAEIALDSALDGLGTAGVLAAAGLPAGFAGRNPQELSSGERRRLAVAMVVLAGRPLLLLDEPTAGLDAHGRRRILQLLAEVSPATALVIASHDKAFLKDCGCQICTLGARGLASQPGTGREIPLVSEQQGR